MINQTMKRFKSSELSTNRSEVMEAARNGGAIIEERRTNGKVIDEFILIDDEGLRRATGHSVKSIRQSADEIHIDDNFEPLDFTPHFTCEDGSLITIEGVKPISK